MHADLVSTDLVGPGLKTSQSKKDNNPYFVVDKKMHNEANAVSV